MPRYKSCVYKIARKIDKKSFSKPQVATGISAHERMLNGPDYWFHTELTNHGPIAGACGGDNRPAVVIVTYSR
uniref:Uncharacterized protein n=1 Tax=Peronospora matthiolae TaxID=2874970 RepID=A0AAV1VMB1_9STRA